MDSSSCLKDQDLSDLLAKDLAERLIDKNQKTETERKVKKLRTSREDPYQKTVDYSLVDLKYINKTPDEIIENTLQELSSLNDLLNHALDKTLGFNDSITTPPNLIQSIDPVKSSTSTDPFNSFKVPSLPSRKSSTKSSLSSKANNKNSSSKSKDISIENDLIQSIAEEVIGQGTKKEDGDIEGDSKLRSKKKKKKCDKHTCTKHRKRKEQSENEIGSGTSSSISIKSQVTSSKEQQPYSDSSLDRHSIDENRFKTRDNYYSSNKSYQEGTKYYSSIKRTHKKSYESIGSSDRYYSDEEHSDDRTRKYDSNDKYYNKPKHKYRELDSRPYGGYTDRYRYDKYHDKYNDKYYEKSYESRHEKYDDDKFDYKDPEYLKQLKAKNNITNWTKFCSQISREQDDDNSSIESRDFYSDDDDTRSMMSERILNRDTLKAKEIKFEVRDFKIRQARSAADIKKELAEQYPVSAGLNHQWKEVATLKSTEKKSDDKKIKKSSKAVDSKEREIEEEVDDFLSKHLQGNKSGFDIGAIMSQRLNALKILKTDANNVTALNQLKEADDSINEWLFSRAASAQDELSNRDPNLDPSIRLITIDNQTYQSYSDFTKAAKSKDGIGMALLCKMGWQPGQCLGKNNEGVVEPLIPELKLDTKGLITEEEKATSRRNNVQNMYNIPQSDGNTKNSKKKSKKIDPSLVVDCKTISNTNLQQTDEQLTAMANQSIMTGKHPVNILQEVCSRHKWTTPTYTIVNEDGPAHKKNFLIKCTLNNVDYLPSFSSPNKKLAKAIAAIVCLQAFGLINYDEINN